MTFDELTPLQKIQAKQDYVVRLADKGILMQFLQGDEHEEERGPSWSELADADKLVSDDIMRKEGVDYVKEDFGPDGYEVRDCDKILRWALKYITLDNMMEDTGTFLLDEASMSAARMALDWAREAVARKCSELVKE